MSAPDWIIQRGFPESVRDQAAHLYFDAFAGKLGGLLGWDGRGVAFFRRILDPDFALSALSKDGDRLLGIAGFKTAEGSMTAGGLGDLTATYGWFGMAWRAPFLALLERDRVDDQLLMDGIAVAPKARGLGIGTALLKAVVREANRRKLSTVRLDVIDTNPKARALYERFGFVVKSTEELGFLRHIFGFSSSSTMVLDVNKFRDEGR